MAFAIRNLSVNTYTNGFTLWHYKAESDTLEAVRAPGYFDNATDMVAKGDMMTVAASDGGQMLFVTSTNLETVVVEPMK